MKTISPIIVSTILSFLILLSPTIFISDLEKAIGVGASILSGFAGVGAIVFGYIIYKDLGIGKKMMGKTADVVIALCEELKAMRIQAAYYSGEVLRGVTYFGLKKGDNFDKFYSNSDIDKSNVGDFFILFLPENYFSRLEGYTS